MYLKADLHLHTSASDGKLSPKELVNFAKAQDLDVIAITDHDTVDGVEEGISYGEKIGIKVIPGIELSTTHNGESIHILGYFRDSQYKNNDFRSILCELTDFRVIRGKKIVDNLHKYFGISLDYEDILKEAKGVIARPHIAKAIVKSGYSNDWEYIFKNILGENSPAFVPKKNLSIEDGIKLLKSVNAIAVLAHPVLIKKSTVESLLSFSFDGIEAIYHMNSEGDYKNYTSLACKHNKIITAGSDFHGIAKNDSSHGIVGCVYLEGENLNRFMNILECG